MSSLAVALIAARLVHFSTLMMVFGAALFELTVDRSATFSTRQYRVAAYLTVGSGLTWVTCSLAEMAGGIDKLTLDLWVDVLLHASFGPPRLVHLALCGVMIGLAGVRRSGQVVVAAMALTSLAAIGHAAAAIGTMLPVRLALQALHLIAAGAWLGALPALIVVLRAGDLARSQAVLVRFSTVGILAVAAILTTGVANGVLLLPAPAALFTTAYGQLLSLKIVLVCGMLGLAVANKTVLTPRLVNSPERPGTVTRLVWTIGCEQALGLLVVLAASVLGTWSPSP